MLDMLKIESKFTKMIVSKMISRTLKKKCGYDITVSLDDLTIDIINGDANVKLAGNAIIRKETIEKLTDEFF